MALQRVAAFLQGPPAPFDLDRALRTYRRAAFAYEQCGLYAEARQVHYHAQYLKMRRGRELGLSPTTRFELWAYWLTAGFGYRPMLVLASAATVVLAFAVVYFAFGGVLHSGGGEMAGLLDSLYFSGVTFSTVGYGDLVPASESKSPP